MRDDYYISQDDWAAKEEAARNQLAIAYADGVLGINDPVDANLRNLAKDLVRVIVQAEHVVIVYVD